MAIDVYQQYIKLAVTKPKQTQQPPPEVVPHKAHMCQNRPVIAIAHLLHQATPHSSAIRMQQNVLMVCSSQFKQLGMHLTISATSELTYVSE